jgi:hypothetical protein
MHEDNNIVAFVDETLSNRAYVVSIGDQVCIRRSRSVHGRQSGHVKIIPEKLELFGEGAVALRRVPSPTNGQNRGSVGSHRVSKS